MDNFDRDLDDLLNMTDSDDDASTDSSNGGIFENRDPVVLELHELKKDEPGTEPMTEAQESKKKRERRRKKKQQQDANRDEASDTSSTLSDSVPTLPDDTNREEFYDAHESYHALPENQQASPTAALVLAQVHSQHVEDPKTMPERTATSGHPSATPREPSTINKPVSNPPPQ